MTYKAVFDGTGLRRCILIICPMSHDQSGRKLVAAVEAIKAAQLDCEIFLADDLDRHNTGSLETARLRADHWLARHGEILKELSPDITRWSEITVHPTFADRYASIQQIYRAEPGAKILIDGICCQHTALTIERLREKGIEPNSERIMQASIDYMLEEIAGLAVIHDLNPAPEIYPGLHFSEPGIFNQYADVKNLTLPDVRSLSFEVVDLTRVTRAA